MRRRTTTWGGASDCRRPTSRRSKESCSPVSARRERCYDEHEKVLALDPSRKDAGLIVGTYRYVVSTLSLPMRMLAYVAGFGGGRERGIQMLRETAELDLRYERRTRPDGSRDETGNDARTDALFALVLVYNREHRYDDALQVLERTAAPVSAQPAVVARSRIDRASGGARRSRPTLC